MFQLQDATLDCGCTLNPNMIPYFMPLSLAQEVLFIGKTVILFGFDPKKVKRNSSFIASRNVMTPLKYGADSRRFVILFLFSLAILLGPKGRLI